MEDAAPDSSDLYHVTRPIVPGSDSASETGGAAADGDCVRDDVVVSEEGPSASHDRSTFMSLTIEPARGADADAPASAISEIDTDEVACQTNFVAGDIQPTRNQPPSADAAVAGSDEAPDLGVDGEEVPAAQSTRVESESGLGRMSSVSQRSRVVTSRQEFQRHVLGEGGRPRPMARWRSREEKRAAESPFQGAEAEEAARQIMRGQRPKILNACGIADVIDELTKFQLQAMQEGDYRQGEAIHEAICNLRRDYREKDRLNYQETRVLSLKEKLQIAERRLSERQKKLISPLTPGRRPARNSSGRRQHRRRRIWTFGTTGSSRNSRSNGKRIRRRVASIREARRCSTSSTSRSGWC
jgi:hypothetical protein